MKHHLTPVTNATLQVFAGIEDSDHALEANFQLRDEPDQEWILIAEPHIIQVHACTEDGEQLCYGIDLPSPIEQRLYRHRAEGILALIEEGHVRGVEDFIRAGLEPL